MPKVRCKYCNFLKDRKCTAKKTGGKHPTVKVNMRRFCTKFSVNVEETAKVADKEYYKKDIPRFAPTWRYYASKKELKELNEENGPKFIRINPDVNNNSR